MAEPVKRIYALQTRFDGEQSPVIFNGSIPKSHLPRLDPESIREVAEGVGLDEAAGGADAAVFRSRRGA